MGRNLRWHRAVSLQQHGSSCVYSYSGGTEVTVTGTHLDSVAEPRITVAVITHNVTVDRFTPTATSEVLLMNILIISL